MYNDQETPISLKKKKSPRPITTQKVLIKCNFKSDFDHLHPLKFLAFLSLQILHIKQ